MPPEDETVIAFYGARLTPERLGEFYRFATESFEKLGHPPSNVLISKQDVKGRYTTFKTADAKLSKDGFGDVTAIEMNAAIPNPKYKWKDQYVSAFVDNRKYPFVHFSSLSSIVPLSRAALLPLANALIRIIQPAYGIGYKMARDQGPTWYAVGIGYSKDIDTAVAKRSGKAGDEALNISRWGHTYMPARVWEWGFLRDVYPWNFLNDVQRVKQAGDCTLEKWICQNPSRGLLTPLHNGLVLWEVKDEHISEVKTSLLDAGVIFSWDKHRSLLGA